MVALLQLGIRNTTVWDRRDLLDRILAGLLRASDLLCAALLGLGNSAALGKSILVGSPRGPT